MESLINNVQAVWQYLTSSWLQLPFLILILYAIWHLLRTRSVVANFYQKRDFSARSSSQLTGVLQGRESILLMSLDGWDKNQDAPLKAWVGQHQGYQVYQYVSKRKRGTNFIRKKASYRTQYTVTIVESPVSLLEFCARPKMVLDAVDYVFDGHDIGIPGEDEFSRLYHVRGTEGGTSTDEQVQACLGEPLRNLLLQVEGLSIETLADRLILLRVRDYFEIEGNLETELESAVEIVKYIAKISSSK